MRLWLGYVFVFPVDVRDLYVALHLYWIENRDPFIMCCS
jgi:hypothetical protein